MKTLFPSIRFPVRPVGLALALAMGLAAASLPGWGRDLPEHQVKAAFLFNFAAFVKWPDEAFPDVVFRERILLHGLRHVPVGVLLLDSSMCVCESVGCA